MEISSSWLYELIIKEVLTYPEPEYSSTYLAAVLFLHRSDAFSELAHTADADWVAALLASLKAAVQRLIFSLGTEIQKGSQVEPEQQSHTGTHGAAQPPAATCKAPLTRKRKAACNLIGETCRKANLWEFWPRPKSDKVEQVRLLSKQYEASCKKVEADGIESKGRCSSPSVVMQSAQAVAREV